MLYTEKYRTECAAKNPGDQSGPRSKRVDSGQTSSWSSSSHARRSARQPRQQKLTPAEAHSSRRKLPPVERMCVRGRRQGPTTQAATTETSHASRSSSSSSSSQQAHDLLWICWEILLTMWTEAVSISASRYCGTLSRQQRS